ncbi:MAG: RusA family crossover junction endodeoxyribonuclease [Anaerovoracaceae bacterium]
MKTEFFIPMVPPTVTHQEKKVSVKNGKPNFYEPPELKAARTKLMAHFGKHIPESKYTGGVMLLVKWCFPIKGKHEDGEYRITKPDTDNLQKLLKDVMTDLGYWADDALVALEHVEKFWADIPGIYVLIAELDAKKCPDCKWLHDEVCCNDRSEWCADFPQQNTKCDYFEKVNNEHY